MDETDDREHAATPGPLPYWSPYLAGFGLGLTLLLAFWVLGTGLGASAGLAPEPGLSTWSVQRT